MSTPQKPGAVLFAKDLPRVARFYEGVAELVSVHAEAGLIVLESPNQQLVLHANPKGVAKSVVISSPPRRREEIAVKLIFPVGRLADAREKAPALGGELNPKNKEFEARGFVACDGHDPEGNVVQFREEARPRRG